MDAARADAPPPATRAPGLAGKQTLAAALPLARGVFGALQELWALGGHSMRKLGVRALEMDARLSRSRAYGTYITAVSVASLALVGIMLVCCRRHRAHDGWLVFGALLLALVWVPYFSARVLCFALRLAGCAPPHPPEDAGRPPLAPRALKNLALGSALALFFAVAYIIFRNVTVTRGGFQGDGGATSRALLELGFGVGVRVFAGVVW